MKKEFLIFFGILVLIGVSLYAIESYGVLKPKPPESEITLDRFKEIIGKNEKFSIVMYAEQDPSKSKNVLNCGISLSGSLAGMGKKVDNYAFEGDYCIWQDPVNLAVLNLSQSNCADKFKQDYYFEIRYGGLPPRFYESRATLYIDESFNKSCEISRKSP